MKAGRRSLKQGALEGCPEPQPGDTLMRVVALRGSNLIEVEDADGNKTLCMLPAKFRKSMWIKTGNFVLVEEGDREKASDAGSKVTGTIVRVLYDDHIRALQKTSFWPPSFRCSSQDTSEKAQDAPETPSSRTVLSHGDSGDTESEDSDDDGLPLLEANMNGQHPKGLYESSDSDSDDD